MKTIIFIFFIITKTIISPQVEDSIGSKAYCESHKTSVVCSKIATIISSIITVLVFLIFAICVILCIRNLIRYKRERNNRINRINQERILLEKKINYLFSHEIKPVSFAKEKLIEYEKCPICLETYNNEKEICITPCKHYFHFYCLSKYIIESKAHLCPMCKFNFFSIFENKDINFDQIETHLILVEHPNTNRVNSNISS